jgi:lysozyme
MQFSDTGLALIKQSEGLRAAVYLDVRGLRTIGYGHRLQPRESYPNGINDVQASAILVKDVAIAERAVSAMVRVVLTQGQYDALVDFVFNLGAQRLYQSTLLRDLNAGQYDAAALQLLLWDHAGDKELDALKKRRAAEYTLWTGHTPVKE